MLRQSIPHLKKLKSGFTLLEVSLAIAIFAIISLASFSIFDTVVKSEERSKKQTERLNDLQRAFLIIEREITQIARRNVRLNGEGSSKSYLHTSEGSFDSETRTLGFVRHGWTNPGLILPRSDMQAVAYQLNENTLERLHFIFVDPVVGEEPKVRPLLSEVVSLKFEFYDGDDWQQSLENNNFPQAIAVEIETEDMGVIRRQFITAGDRPRNSQQDGF